MSQLSSVSKSKRTIKVESKSRTGSDPTVLSLRKTNSEKVSSTDNLIGQPCSNCSDKCHGYMPHVWRKKCVTCGCPRYQHLHESDPHDTLVYLEVILNLQDGHSHELKLKDKYVWYPKTSPDLVESYMECLPKDKVPLRGSDGEKNRMRRFMRQLPDYDSNLDACHKMADLDRKRMTKFIDRTRRRFFGVGVVRRMVEHGSLDCVECCELIESGAVYVQAERASDDQAWHPQCFICETCQELLVDLIYFYSPEKKVIYCGRHHGESFVPRCTTCDELIFSATVTESEDKKYHKEHFCCSECDTILHGNSYKEVSSNLYCSRCYDKNVAAICEKCQEPIGIGAKVINFKGGTWHKQCFACRRCQEDLSEDKCFLIKGDLLCSDCVDPVAQCHACKAAIVPTYSYVKHKTRAWHADCFKCTICQAWLVDGEYQELDDNLMCTPCYADKVGKKCTICTKSIIGKAVKFGFGIYHAKCFNCGSCGMSLVGYSGKVKEKEEQPLCQECALKTAKKCFRCRQPIIKKHTIYRDRPFHLECFTCNLCGSSVATQEFFETSLGEILCQKCTKIK